MLRRDPDSFGMRLPVPYNCSLPARTLKSRSGLWPRGINLDELNPTRGRNLPALRQPGHARAPPLLSSLGWLPEPRVSKLLATACTPMKTTFEGRFRRPN